MLFCTGQFAFFFLLVFVLYWSMPWPKARVYLLLAASFLFYASWSAKLALLIVVSTTVDFFLARGIEASTSARRRKLLLAINITGNLGLLCYFKYTNFFLESLQQALNAAGYGVAWAPLKIMLPVGISFYTFEAISYMVDVYRGRVRAEKNLAHFQLFILFFPHLVAGPIVRGRDFLPQVNRRKRWSWARAQVGVQLFLLGLVKKMVVADRMAQFVDPVFAHPADFGTGVLWMALIAYALQVYGDFSGYSDMALGCAHLLGYKLVQNFNMPYLALNIGEFWNRWHMSLGSWLRDYVFIPLGGSRGGNWKTARNLLITLTLCGLWHGSGWNYVLYGFLQGALLIVHRGFYAFARKQPRLDAVLQTVPGIVLRWVLAMLSVLMGYVIFRAVSYDTTQAYFSRLFVPCFGQGPPLHPLSLWFTVVLVAAAHAATASGVWERWSLRVPAFVLGASYAFIFAFALVLAPAQGQAFIYFQF